MTWAIAFEPATPNLAGAACSNHPEPLWDERAYHGERETAAAKRWARAVKICQECPVLAGCRPRTTRQGGVWGGRIFRTSQAAPRRHLDTTAARRAQRVRELTAAGMSCQAIADRLGITPNTVSRIRTRLRRAEYDRLIGAGVNPHTAALLAQYWEGGRG